MLIISIDGACRRNGKPDCVASGGVFVQSTEHAFCECKSVYEMKSTNQRGELLALLTALDYVYSAKQDAMVITDSEYIFNAMTKDWYRSWMNKGWVTASGEDVKNKDIWLQVFDAMQRIAVDVVFYHIKGHCIPFGKVTQTNLLNCDNSGAKLRAALYEKYDEVAFTSKLNNLNDAQKLSERNNGFVLSEEQLKLFVVSNIMADAIATRCVDAADALSK